MNIRRYLSFKLILFILVILVQLFVVFLPARSLMNWFPTDDAFYYFKVAQNITEGRGITLDGVNPTNGFHPLWMLVCIPLFSLARYDLFLPLRLVALVSILLSAGNSYWIYSLLEKRFSRTAAITAGLAWAFLPTIHEVVVEGGMETALSAFFLAWLLFAAARWDEAACQGKLNLRQLVGVGTLAGLLVLSRLDNIFIAALIGIWLGLRCFRYRSLILAGSLLYPASLLLTFAIWFGENGIFPYLPSALLMSLSAILLFPAALWLARSPRFTRVPTWLKTLLIGGLPALAASALAFLLNLLGLLTFLSRGTALLFPLLSAVLVGGMVFIYNAYAHGEPAIAPEALPARWKGFVRTGFFYSLPAGGLLGAFMAWSYLTFGIPSPVSGQVKHWWSTLSNTVYGLPDGRAAAFLGIDLEKGGAWSLFYSAIKSTFPALTKTLSSATQVEQILAVLIGIAILAAGLWFGARRLLPAIGRIGLLPLLVGCSMQIYYYHLSGYAHMRAWYWSGELLLSVLIFTLLFEALYRALNRTRRSRWLANCLAGFVIVGVLWISLAPMLQIATSNGEGSIASSYQARIDFVQQNTQPGDIIGVPGAGYLAYFLPDRTFVNMDGLINSPAYFAALKSGTAADFLAAMRVQYVYGSMYMIEKSQPYDAMLAGRVELVREDEGNGLYRWLKP